MTRFYVLVALLVFLSGCRTLGPNAAGGGAFGGLAGGLAGAAIGATEGKAPEGALIGAVTGATVGTIAGNAVDRDKQQQRLADQQYRNQRLAGAISMEQIVRMTQSGLGSDVVARQISSQGVAKRPTIDDLIFLKQNGVDDRIIQAMQTAPVAGQVLPASYVQASPVVVEPAPVIIESYPPFYPRRFCPPPRRPRRRPQGVELSFGF